MSLLRAIHDQIQQIEQETGRRPNCLWLDHEDYVLLHHALAGYSPFRHSWLMFEGIPVVNREAEMVG